MKNLLIVALALGAVAYLAFYAFSWLQKAATAEDIFIVHQNQQETHFQVELVCSQEARKQGLSDRNPLNAGQGMVFVFEHPSKHGIWMKSMRFALDIVWFDERQRVVYIERHVQPDTYPQVFSPPSPSLYVLEILAGAGKEIRLGDTIQFAEPVQLASCR